MIKKILIPVIIILFLKSCGYTPIFTSKNLDINFNNIDYKKNALNKSFARSIKSLSNINSSNFYDVEINAESNRATVAKDSKGNAEVYKLELSLEITLIGKSNESKIKETFMKSVNYKNSSDKFQLKQNENNLIDQMTQSILQDILKFVLNLT
tara:strand:- start:4284 stop:4742 length:459 start_codon:yes stop_codon:yes gene_type:complete